MQITRRTLLVIVSGLLAAGHSLRAIAQERWPSRPVRLVSPYGAGGANDISLRILADQLERRLSQKLIVENKPGAGTRIANETVAHAAPDGYTFLYAAAPYATAEALYGKVNYQRKELQPVAMAVVALVAEQAHRPRFLHQCRQLVEFFTGLRRLQVFCIDLLQDVVLSAACGEAAFLWCAESREMDVGDAARI